MASHSSLYEWFEQACIEQFSFLENRLGFRREKMEADATEAAIFYSREDVGVSVRYEPLDNVVIVYIVKTKDGNVPDYNATDWINVDNFIRDGSLPEVKQENYGKPFSNTSNDFRRILSGYSAALEDCIEDQDSSKR